MLHAQSEPVDVRGLRQRQRASPLGAGDRITRLAGNEEAVERLTIRSGESVSQQGDPTYYMEYKLNDDWSVTGEYDRFNALNAGLKWHLYSK